MPAKSAPAVYRRCGIRDMEAKTRNCQLFRVSFKGFIFRLCLIYSPGIIGVDYIFRFLQGLDTVLKCSITTQEKRYSYMGNKKLREKKEN